MLGTIDWKNIRGSGSPWPHPFLRQRFFVKIPLVNPSLKSVPCVPPLWASSDNENPCAKPHWEWGPPGPLYKKNRWRRSAALSLRSCSARLPAPRWAGKIIIWQRRAIHMGFGKHNGGWHKDLGGLRKIQILIREQLKECLKHFLDFSCLFLGLYRFFQVVSCLFLSFLRFLMQHRGGYNYSIATHIPPHQVVGPSSITNYSEAMSWKLFFVDNNQNYTNIAPQTDQNSMQKTNQKQNRNKTNITPSKSQTTMRTHTHT